MYISGYWIETVEQTDEGMTIIKLSCSKHCSCIEIYGDKKTVTERMLVILTALNKQEE